MPGRPRFVATAIAVALAAGGATGAVALTKTMGAVPATSAAPDLMSTKLVAGQARYCFDEAIAAGSVAPTGFWLSPFDSAVAFRSTAAAIDTDPKCVLASFAPGDDIAAATLGYVSAAAVANAAGTPAPQESAPVTDGFTDGPDLARTWIDDVTNTVLYVFDEEIRADPVPIAAGFHVIEADGSVATGLAGSVVVGTDRRNVAVRFADPISGSNTAGVSNDLGAVVDDGGNVSPPGSVGLPLGGCAETVCPGNPFQTATPTATPGTPYPVVRPGLTVKISPRRDRRRPFRFTVSGRLDPRSVGPAACNGRIRIRGKVSARTWIRELTQVTPACTYAARVRLPKRAGARGRVGFRVRFERTALLLPVSKGNPGFFGEGFGSNEPGTRSSR